MMGAEITAKRFQLQLIQVCYEYVYLTARKTAGSSSFNLSRLAALRRMLEEPADGRGRSAGLGRREHRRFALSMQVRIKGGAGIGAGTVLNMSGGGMLLACEGLEVGSRVQVLVGEPGADTRYTFVCEVVRHDDSGSYGLRFSGAPLEIRYGSRAPARLSA